MLVLRLYMKRIIAIPLLVLYLTAISGMMVQIHFCGSKLSSWNVNKAKAVCCCEESGKLKPAHNGATTLTADDDCCSDKTITLKIAEQQNKTAEAQWQLIALELADVPVFAFPDFIFREASDTEHVYAANAPPGRWQNLPLYKLYTSYIFYG